MVLLFVKSLNHLTEMKLQFGLERKLGPYYFLPFVPDSVEVKNDLLSLFVNSKQYNSVFIHYFLGRVIGLCHAS